MGFSFLKEIKMSNRIEQAIKITKVGTLVTSGAASASVAIPTNSAGDTAKVIRIICPVSAAYAYVLPGNGSVVATTSAIAINDTTEYLDVSGCTHIAYIQGSAAAVINIVPIEW